MRKSLLSQLLEGYLFEFHILLGDHKILSYRDLLDTREEDRADAFSASLERFDGLKKRMARGE